MIVLVYIVSYVIGICVFGGIFYSWLGVKDNVELTWLMFCSLLWPVALLFMFGRLVGDLIKEI